MTNDNQPSHEKKRRGQRGPGRPVAEKMERALDKLILAGLTRGVAVQGQDGIVYVTPSAKFIEVANRRLNDIRNGYRTHLNLLEEAELRARSGMLNHPPLTEESDDAV